MADDLTDFDRHCREAGIEPNTDECMTAYEAWRAARDRNEHQLRELHKVIDALMQQREQSDATIALVLTKTAFDLASVIEAERHCQTDSRPMLRAAIRDAFAELRAVVDGLTPTSGEVKTGEPS